MFTQIHSFLPNDIVTFQLKMKAENSKKGKKMFIVISELMTRIQDFKI